MQIVVSSIFWISAFLFFWTYFGYPFLMFLRARIAPDAVHKADYEPSVTMVIPTYNEVDVIRRKLTNCRKLDYPTEKLQIMVIDDGSDDGTVEILEEFERIYGFTIIHKPKRTGKMESVNIGFAQAEGEIVILSDASPSYEEESLRILLRSFADERVGVVVGTLAIWDAETSVAKPAGLYWNYEAALRRWETHTGSTVAVHGNMFAIRKHLFKPLSVGTINDEFSIAMEALKAGKRVVYERDAVSYDDASTNMGDEFRRRVRINAGRYQALFGAGYLNLPTLDLKFRLFSHKLLRPLTPIFMLLMLVMNLLALVWASQPVSSPFVLGGWWGVSLMVAQALFYAAAFLGWQLEKQEKRNKLLNVIYFFVSSNIAALFGFWRWARGSQKVTWQKRSSVNS